MTALRLAQAGIPAVMLERGRRWPLTPAQDTFSSLASPDGRSAWLSDTAVLGDPKPIDRYIGVLELTVGDGIAAFAGAGVGGGSLVSAGALVEPPRSLLRRTFGRAVDVDELAAVHYPRVRRVIGAEPIPRRILERREYAAARAWAKLGHEAGLPVELIDMALDWHTVRLELDGERVPSVIAGAFWYGNNSGAKLSLDRNYLRRAEATGRLTIEAQQDVASIAEGPDGRHLVTVDEIADDGTVLRTRAYAARRLFLGAGSLGTSRLLVRARGRGAAPARRRRRGAVGEQRRRLLGAGRAAQPGAPRPGRDRARAHPGPVEPGHADGGRVLRRLDQGGTAGVGVVGGHGAGAGGGLVPLLAGDRRGDAGVAARRPGRDRGRAGRNGHL